MIEPKRSMVVSDEVVRRFLLGDLTANEREAFENRLVTDDELEGRVRLSELELADDYAQQRLPRAELLRARERFLITRDRQHIAALSQALHDRFRPAAQANARRFFDLTRPAWRYAFAAIILVIVFATVWLKVKERRLAGKVPPPRPFQPKSSPTQSPATAHHSAGSSAPAHPEEAIPPPEHDTTVSVALDAKNVVGNPLELKLSDRGITSLRIIATLERNQFDSYRAELWNSRGAAVFTADGLTPSDAGKLVVDIPALDLSAGEYLIRFNGSGDEPGLQYYLRVIR